MHKCVYTVTLDIECWDDLKVEKIDWAKSINLFPCLLYTSDAADE